MPVNSLAIATVPTQSIEDDFYRLIRTKYANEPMSMFGAIKQGGRYNIVGFGALYLGFDPDICHAEVTQGILAGLPTKKDAFKLWQYKVKLQAIVRLDEKSVLHELGVTTAEISIKGNHETASTIGNPLFKRGVEGLVAPSAQKLGGLCLDVFLDNVKSPSNVQPLNMCDFP